MTIDEFCESGICHGYQRIARISGNVLLRQEVDACMDLESDDGHPFASSALSIETRGTSMLSDDLAYSAIQSECCIQHRNHSKYVYYEPFPLDPLKKSQMWG